MADRAGWENLRLHSRKSTLPTNLLCDMGRGGVGGACGPRAQFFQLDPLPCARVVSHWRSFTPRPLTRLVPPLLFSSLPSLNPTIGILKKRISVLAVSVPAEKASLFLGSQELPGGRVFGEIAGFHSCLTSNPWTPLRMSIINVPKTTSIVHDPSNPDKRLVPFRDISTRRVLTPSD